MKTIGIVIACGLTLGLVVSLSFWAGQRFENNDQTFPVPFISQPEPKPLLAYTIDALSQREYSVRPLTIEKILAEEDSYTSFLFSFKPLDRKMTGVINVPTTVGVRNPVRAIVLLRGYVPPEIYAPGVGTKNAAAYFAERGFITVAPDFFGYGESDPEPSDSWQARFEKPAVVIELLKTLETEPLAIPNVEDGELTASSTEQSINSIGIWAHSNGGQIALTTLEILNKPIPTTLWAPVTAPFPYSILFFSDEYEDEGKTTRLWLSQFEEDYNVFDFSLTKHLNHLQGPLQLHHGTADEAALKVWSDEFVAKVDAENESRAEQATPSAAIDLTYFTYPGADHNLQPAWATVIARDLEFFNRTMK